MIVTRGFALTDWQRDAVDAWVEGDGRSHFRGTFEIFTGGGKTLIALSCAAVASAQDAGLKLAVVVPTQALARQWAESIAKHTTIEPHEIGLLGAGKRQTFDSHRVLVAVINSAAVHLPKMVRAMDAPVMLIVDECHRAGADTFKKVLATQARCTLGLSATPEREELDEHGEPLHYDEQAVATALGKLVFSFGLKEAREAGWLPQYEIHHHGVELDPPERVRYDALSREVDDAKKRLEGLGQETRRARLLFKRNDDVGAAARAYTALTGKRKDLLYRAIARNAVASRLVRDELAADANRRIIVFHERVAEIDDLYETLSHALDPQRLALEHSKLPNAQRQESLVRFRSGAASVLFSVKSLVEGIDVPEADIGISVASSTSVRQRIQALGRVLRRSFEEKAAPKNAVMHVIYVAKTVDEQIYAKEDWGDITGSDNNMYWHWTGDERQSAPGPPLEPLLSEESTWDGLGRTIAATHTLWPGAPYGQEYSVDTMGNVRNAFGASIVNPQNVAARIAAVRGRDGGRFRVTPKYKLILVSTHDGTSLTWHLAGQLSTPFETERAPEKTNGDTPPRSPNSYVAGDRFATNLDASKGTYKLRHRNGGVVEKGTRKSPSQAVADPKNPSPQSKNALSVLKAWKALNIPGTTFYINADDIAWLRIEGTARFLAHVPDGFSWPQAIGSNGNAIDVIAE